MNPVYSKINFLLQDFYLIRRDIRRNFDSGDLGVTESQILFEIFINQPISQVTLSSFFDLNKSSVSRILEKLNREKYLTFRKDISDARIKVISLLKKGRDYVHSVQESSNEIVNILFSDFSFEDQLKFAFFINHIADSHKVLKGSMLPDDHPITIAFARLGRASGMAGNFFLHSKFTGTEYYILKLIRENKGETITSISNKLIKDKSTVSRIVKKFYSKKILTKPVKKQGTPLLTLSSTGLQAFDEVNILAANFIKTGLSSFKKHEVEEFQNMLSRLVKNNSRPTTPSVSDINYAIRRITSLDERKLARGLLIAKLVKEGNHFDTPDLMFSERCDAFGLFNKDDLVAACVRVKKGSKYEIFLQCAQSDLSEALFRSFLESSVQKV